MTREPARAALRSSKSSATCCGRCLRGEDDVDPFAMDWVAGTACLRRDIATARAPPPAMGGTEDEPTAAVDARRHRAHTTARRKTDPGCGRRTWRAARGWRSASSGNTKAANGSQRRSVRSARSVVDEGRAASRPARCRARGHVTRELDQIGIDRKSRAAAVRRRTRPSRDWQQELLGRLSARGTWKRSSKERRTMSDSVDSILNAPFLDERASAHHRARPARHVRWWGGAGHDPLRGADDYASADRGARRERAAVQ